MNHVSKFLKFKNWWAPKIGTGIFTWFLFSIYFDCNQGLFFHRSHWLVFGTLVLLALFGHLVNDISDLKQDIQAGKVNFWNKINPKFSPWILVSLGAISLILASLVSSQITLLILVQLVLNILYSVHPVRLKERGWLSMIVTGFYERALPYLVILFSLNHAIVFELKDSFFLIAYFTWAYSWECRNYINGQLRDRELDVSTGLKTLSVIVDNEKLVAVKSRLFFVEFLAYISWLVALAFRNFLFFSTFSAVLALIIVTHRLTIKNLYYLKKAEYCIDFIYTHVLFSAALIASMIVMKTSICFNVSLLLLFTSRYTIEIIRFVYHRIFFVASFVINNTIFYIRKLFFKN